MRSGRAGPILSLLCESMQSTRGGAESSRRDRYLFAPPAPLAPVICLIPIHWLFDFHCHGLIFRLSVLSLALEEEINFRSIRARKSSLPPRTRDSFLRTLRGYAEGEKVCNTLRAYGGHDCNPDINLGSLFAPGHSQRAIACRLSLPYARTLHPFGRNRKDGPCAA